MQSGGGGGGGEDKSKSKTGQEASGTRAQVSAHTNQIFALECVRHRKTGRGRRLWGV